MPVFQYQAINKDGKLERGLLQGASIDVAARLLSEKGLEVQELSVANSGLEPETPSNLPPTEARSRVQTEFVAPLFQAVPLNEIHFFFRQFGTMLHAGINPVQALETLARQAQSPKLKAVLSEARDHVAGGRPLSVGLQRYPEVFSPLVVSMVRAGEEGGFLSDQCQQISEYIQRDIELRNLIRRETAYPKIVVAASVFIIFGANVLITAIRPGGQGLAMPILLWIIFAAALVGGFLFARVGLKNPAIKQSFDRFTIKLPGIGGMIHGFAMAKFGRAFGALYRGGVPLGKATKLAADACGNEAVRAQIYPAIEKMDAGEAITETLAATGAFSPIVLDMARTGEMTGNLDSMLLKVAEYYEDEGTTKSKQAALIFGVVCLLAVAAYVGYIVITFWAGHYSSLSTV